MDREIPVGNRVIDKKMKEYYKKKHRETLYHIRKKPIGNHHNSLASIELKQNRYSFAMEGKIMNNAKIKTCK